MALQDEHVINGHGLAAAVEWLESHGQVAVVIPPYTETGAAGQYPTYRQVTPAGIMFRPRSGGPCQMAVIGDHLQAVSRHTKVIVIVIGHGSAGRSTSPASSERRSTVPEDYSFHDDRSAVTGTDWGWEPGERD